ncbi:MAG: MFS transporter [Dehalococcoidia bacterium]
MRRFFPNVYEGWLIVAASAFYITLTSGAINYGFGTIFLPLREEFAWSVAATAFAFSIRQEASGVAAPFIGMINDRWGPQRTVALGVLIVSSAVFGLSLIQNIWEFYGVMLMISVGASSVGGPVGMAAVTTWFERRRACALALMTIGGGLAGVMVVPIAALVEGMGWRGALRVEALVLLVAGLVPATTTRFRPPDHHQPMDGIRASADGAPAKPTVRWGIPARQAVRTPSFVMLTVGLAGLSFGTATVTVLQIPFLESVGFPTTVAASTVTFYALSSVAGRIGFGFLADRFNPRLILATCVGMTAIGLALLPLVRTPWEAVAVLALLGPGFGGSVPVRTAMIADNYGTMHFGTINGIATFVRTIGSALGPLTVGYAIDRSGAYTIGWLLAAGVVGAGLIGVLLERPPEALRSEWRARAEETAGPATAAHRA